MRSFYAVTGFTFLIVFAILQMARERYSNSQPRVAKVNSELDKFVYSASHDLRAPLASVLGLVNVAKLDPSQENRENYLNLIERSIKNWTVSLATSSIFAQRPAGGYLCSSWFRENCKRDHGRFKILGWRWPHHKKNFNHRFRSVFLQTPCGWK